MVGNIILGFMGFLVCVIEGYFRFLEDRGFYRVKYCWVVFCGWYGFFGRGEVLGILWVCADVSSFCFFRVDFLLFLGEEVKNF